MAMHRQARYILLTPRTRAARMATILSMQLQQRDQRDSLKDTWFIRRQSHTWSRATNHQNQIYTQNWAQVFMLLPVRSHPTTVQVASWARLRWGHLRKRNRIMNIKYLVQLQVPGHPLKTSCRAHCRDRAIHYTTRTLFMKKSVPDPNRTSSPSYSTRSMIEAFNYRDQGEWLWSIILSIYLYCSTDTIVRNICNNKFIEHKDIDIFVSLVYIVTKTP